MVIFMKKENPYNNQCIDCNVFNCKYCNCEDEVCKLSKIKISNMNNEHEKSSTICASFKNKN